MYFCARAKRYADLTAIGCVCRNALIVCTYHVCRILCADGQFRIKCEIQFPSVFAICRCSRVPVFRPVQLQYPRPARYQHVAVHRYLHGVLRVGQAVDRFHWSHRSAAHGAVGFKCRGCPSRLQLRIERNVIRLPAADADEPTVDILVIQFKCVCCVCDSRAENSWPRTIPDAVSDSSSRICKWLPIATAFPWKMCTAR